MGRLGDIADIATVGLIAVGGYLIYRAWKGVEAAIPEVYPLELPGGITIPDIRLKEPIVPTWFEPYITPPDFAAGEEPIGIPGPALRDPDVPSIVDRILRIREPSPEPEPVFVPEPEPVQWGAYPLAFVGRYEIR